MRRFYVPPDQSRGDVFELPEREARHATQVLRLTDGDDLTVLNGAGDILTCTIAAAGKRTVRVAVKRREHHAPLPCALTLIQAIPKGPAFETIVQKATELGAARLIPLLSERVVVDIRERDAAAKVEKWQQIAIESIKQCGSPWLPVIEKPATLIDLLDRRAEWKFSVVASLQAGSKSLRDVVADFLRTQAAPPKTAALWIGPEGDFTVAEYLAIATAGAVPITLGPLILRADTAAIATLALANHELQPRL
ncbi:MAG: Ribosomal small subunit methyltransferase [Verrucomicrobiota bacterium]|jgi:16S rRNA (uracil1498-N3)-methyltransferase